MLDEAAQAMRDQGIGDVVVTRGPTMIGMVTDRDIVVRAIAENLPPKETTARRDRHPRADHGGAVGHCGGGGAGDARAGVRRLLVCDADRKVVGILSLSDVALLPTSTPA